MVTLMAAPGHPLAVGTTLYTTVPADVPVAVRVCAMLLPLPALAPLAPVCEVTVHANVVPATLEVSAIFVAVAEQIVAALRIGRTRLFWI